MEVFLPNLVEISLIKDEEKLVFVGQTLDGMRDALGEIPNVAVVERLALVPAILVDGRDDDASGIDNTPFSLRNNT